MHLLLWAEDSADELRAELAGVSPGAVLELAAPGLLQVELLLHPGQRMPWLTFARQWLPDARPIRAESIREFAAHLAQSVVGLLPDDQPWSLHVEPRYGERAAHHIGARAWHSATRRGERRDARRPGEAAATPVVDPEAGRQRCRLIRQTFLETLQRRRRHLLARLREEPAPFTVGDSLVQLILTAPDKAWLSVAPAPLPFEQRHLLSAFPGGEVPMAADKAAPSRAFAKLLEAELRLGRAIRPGETCVDLGAAPGSWTYVAVRRGAQVIAVDRSPLRDDLLRHPRVEFRSGDAFRFAPERPVDWLLCDVIAAPERTQALLNEWVCHRWAQHFIVTFKLGDARAGDTLSWLKKELPPLTSELFLTRLCANKKEICAFGSVAAG